jgi:hypothetical protein
MVIVQIVVYTTFRIIKDVLVPEPIKRTVEKTIQIGKKAMAENLAKWLKRDQ